MKKTPSYQENTVDKFEAFKKMQKSRSQQNGEVLAPATPEKSNSNSGQRRFLLGRLLRDREAKDCTPERLVESPQKPKVEVTSKFFSSDDSDVTNFAKKNLLTSFMVTDDDLGSFDENDIEEFNEIEEEWEEEVEEEEEDMEVAEESNSNYKSARINNSLGRISLKKKKKKSTDNDDIGGVLSILNDSDASARVSDLLASQKLSKDSRAALMKKKDKEEEEVEEEEENSDDDDDDGNEKKRKYDGDDEVLDDEEEEEQQVQVQKFDVNMFIYKKRNTTLYNK